MRNFMCRLPLCLILFALGCINLFLVGGYITRRVEGRGIGIRIRGGGGEEEREEGGGEKEEYKGGRKPKSHFVQNVQIQKMRMRGKGGKPKSHLQNQNLDPSPSPIFKNQISFCFNEKKITYDSIGIS
jgi:hypothetical protein